MMIKWIKAFASIFFSFPDEKYTFKEVIGDITLAKGCNVIVHGCNCKMTMGAGLAPQMAVKFGADVYDRNYIARVKPFEALGTIDAFNSTVGNKHITVVNAYTQYNPGRNLDMIALITCLKDINIRFEGATVGLPLIGCGIAGGDWNEVREHIKRILIDVNVIIFYYDTATYDKYQIDEI